MLNFAPGAVTAAHSWATAAAGITGLAVGSFLNVVVYRVPRGLSVVAPGSFCPSCGTPLRAVDNVPLLSWLALRARCRSCHAPISPRYPLVEAATGVLFALVAWTLGAHWAVPGACVLGATALSLSVIELDGSAPPPAVALVGGALGLALLVAAGVADRRWWQVGGALLGAGVATAALATSARRRRGRSSRLPWALLPAAVLCGWAGAAGAAAGVVVAGAAYALVAPRGGQLRRFSEGTATAVLAGMVAAVVTAVGTGVPIGR